MNWFWFHLQIEIVDSFLSYYLYCSFFYVVKVDIEIDQRGKILPSRSFSLFLIALPWGQIIAHRSSSASSLIWTNFLSSIFIICLWYAELSLFILIITLFISSSKLQSVNWGPSMEPCSWYHCLYSGKDTEFGSVTLNQGHQCWLDPLEDIRFNTPRFLEEVKVKEQILGRRFLWEDNKIVKVRLKHYP